MVQNTPWKIEEWGGRPCLEEAWGPRLEPGPDGGPISECLVARSAMGPSRAQLEKAKWHSSLPHPVDPPSAGETGWGRVRCHMGGSGGDRTRQPRPGQQRLTLGMWNVTTLGGKEQEPVREVERYWLDLVGLTSMHNMGSGSKHLDRGWTLFFSGVAKGVRHRA